jgi:hypothetical protein
MGFHESGGNKKVIEGLIFFVLMISTAGGDIQYAQEDPGLFVVDVPEYPISPTDLPTGAGPELVLPGIIKASAVIVDLFAGSESDHALFLSDDYWPCILLVNGSTNLTNQTF